jgi:acetyl-CoA carboxylase biotin carboxyl carrier protein
MFDLNWIRQLIELVDESDIDTLEVSRFGSRIVLSKSPPIAAAAPLAAGGAAVSGVPASSSGATAAPPPPASSPGPTPETGSAAETEEKGEDLLEVSSPMVGTFYRAAAPDAPPYVEIGDRVKKGQTLCILEAMKLMNELESEVTGVVREISVQNAEPVEYGQVLFRIAADGAG